MLTSISSGHWVKLFRVYTPVTVSIAGIAYYNHHKVVGLPRFDFFLIHSIMGHHAHSVFGTPGVMALRLNKSFKCRELIPIPDC